MIKIFAIQLPKTFSIETTQRLMHFIDAGRQKKLLRFHRQEDLYRSLLGDLLTKLFISKEICMPVADINILRDSYGKPYLHRVENIHFNVSHSEDWVVAAIGSRQIGIDVEFIQPTDLAVAEIVLTPFELQTFGTMPLEDQLAYFYELWTLKESYVKAVGHGLSIPLHSFEILPFAERDAKLPMHTNARLFDHYRFIQPDFQPNYKIAVCTCSIDLSYSINYIDIHSLLIELENEKAQ